MRFTLDDTWWVQPNFPSWFVLTGDDSFGPGDRDIVFRSGVESFIPAIRSGGAGAPTPFDIEALVENPPPSIEVVESEEVTVGTATGTRTEIMFAESADCAGGDICEYHLVTTFPFPPTSLRVGYHYELWHLDNGIEEPITIITGTPDPNWFPTARAVIDTITFAE